ncbi:tRNA (adenosine(37)-N6)-threonylcarbamoyltransferase complex dimerization subunit type 1 TsaB [Zwartia panacis]|uniref:tRNA (adenosine(37)-N6)-threonylcarbamoyltransferase complex dimerization subunit type 1 TsaB n=1 Tax=Zwartia panacis TaxID=2683345 RepID=UPI0025B29A4A|nr:tRNA (adenosine(37)-N6)-threonylcarbamoyltransferase complex dimerization subunit type 1 TsaB [Zwartia panacis]MDN4016678.1 tRNA (adenosine(37)-N6)-threonylcarbamoyltransferase complex dimerization subunit type 1 TsaB [Zwartia panacis]
MTRILAFETSTSTGTVALISERESPCVVTQRTIEGTTGHASAILPMAYSILTEHNLTQKDLTAVAFGQGPGAFTGVRVACGVAQGIALALDIPVIQIGALPAVALQAASRHPDSLLYVALDARMEEVYFGVYARSAAAELVVVQPPVLLAAADVLLYAEQRQHVWRDRFPGVSSVALVGEGWSVVQNHLAAKLLPAHWIVDDLQARPNAGAVATLALQAWKDGQTFLPEHAAPLYLRDKVAFTTLERARGDGGNPRAQPPGAAALLPMLRADLSEVVALEAAVQSFPWTLKNFEDALEAGYEAWVLRTEDGLKGFAITMLAPDVAHLLVIAVARDAQRRGYGHQLLEHTTRLARSAGTEGIVLEVRPSNASALAFYRSEGFVQIGVRRDYYPAAKGLREDALILKKSFDH